MPRRFAARFLSEASFMLVALRPALATAALLTAAAGPMLLPTPAARAQALADAPVALTLNAAPAGAEVVWVVPDLRGLSDRIAGFSAATGLDRFTPELADALAAFKNEMDLNEGLNDDGALIVAVTGLDRAINTALDDDAANDTEPEAVLLVPVDDYDAFVTALGGDPAVEVAEVRMDGKRGFAREAGGYAAITQTAEAAEAYAPGEAGAELAAAGGGLADTFVGRGQSLVLIDVASMAASLNAAIDRGTREMQGRVDGDPDTPALARNIMPMVAHGYADFLKSLTNGTDTLALALDLSDGGLGLTAGGRLIDGTALADVFTPGGGDDDGGRLSRLPAGDHWLAAGADLSRVKLSGLLDGVRELAGRVKAEAGEEDVAGFPIGEIVDTWTQMLDVSDDATSISSVMYAPAPAAMMGGGFMNQLTLTEMPDADAALKKQADLMAKLGELEIPLPAQDGGEAETMTFNTSWQDNALEINDTPVAQFQVNYVLPPSMMQNFGPAAMLMGNAGSGGYAAATDAGVLTTSVADPQLITRGLNALDADDGGIGADAAITEVRDAELPGNASLEAYVSVKGIANTVNPFLLMFAPGGEQLTVPDDLAPIGFGGNGDGESLVLRAFVPADVVKFGVDTYEQFAPAANGGGNAPADRGRRAPRAL